MKTFDKGKTIFKTQSVLNKGKSTSGRDTKQYVKYLGIWFSEEQNKVINNLINTTFMIGLIIGLIIGFSIGLIF